MRELERQWVNSSFNACSKLDQDFKVLVTAEVLNALLSISATCTTHTNTSNRYPWQTSPTFVARRTMKCLRTLVRAFPLIWSLRINVSWFLSIIWKKRYFHCCLLREGTSDSNVKLYHQWNRVQADEATYLRNKLLIHKANQEGRSANKFETLSRKK